MPSGSQSFRALHNRRPEDALRRPFLQCYHEAYTSSPGHTSYLPGKDDPDLYAIQQSLPSIDSSLTVVATNWQHARQRVVHSYRQWLRAVCAIIFYLMGMKKTEALNDDDRHPKSKPCIPSTCQSHSSERSYGRSSNGTDTSVSCLWWICCCSKATPNSRCVKKVPTRAGTKSLESRVQR